jgi:hypothetical protein
MVAPIARASMEMYLAAGQVQAGMTLSKRWTGVS